MTYIIEYPQIHEPTHYLRKCNEARIDGCGDILFLSIKDSYTTKWPNNANNSSSVIAPFIRFNNERFRQMIEDDPEQDKTLLFAHCIEFSLTTIKIILWPKNNYKFPKKYKYATIKYCLSNISSFFHKCDLSNTFITDAIEPIWNYLQVEWF